ncbi:MAG: TIGR02530 family flagellar biosynthesis protein [Vulcanibacillus sp.]
MNNSIKIGQNYLPNQPIITTKKQNIDNSIITTENFNTIFEEKLNSHNNQIKFSNHAKQRLDLRGIELDSDIMSQLNQAVEKAEAKGSKDSLILVKDIAFVINIPNKVVITTIDDKSIKDHIFTNIDSAIIL